MTEGLFDDKEAWKRIIAGADLLRPSKGKLVRVIEGKRSGQVGRVFWHGRDKFSDAWRYGSPAEWHLRDINGRYGWRVGVKTEAGDKFFVNADSVEVVQGPAPDEHLESQYEERYPEPDEEEAHERYMDAWASRVEQNTPPEYR